jgi:hypothetical protein
MQDAYHLVLVNHLAVHLVVQRILHLVLESAPTLTSMRATLRCCLGWAAWMDVLLSETSS